MSLIVDADFMEIASGKANVHNLILDRPIVKLLRSRSDSTWNYNHIVEPGTPTEQGEAGEFFIDLTKCLIKDGSFMFIDSVEAPWDYEAVAYNRMYFDSINLDMTAYIELHNNSFETDINDLSLEEVFSGVKIHKLTTEASISPNLIRAEKMNVTTPNNEISLECSITNYDVFWTGGNTLIENAIFDVEVFANDVDDEEVRKFGYIPIEIENIDELYFKANGTLNDLDVNEVGIVSDRTEIDFSAKLMNLIYFDDFYFEVDFKRSNFILSEINQILPDIDLSAISNIRSFRTNKLVARGNYDSTNVDLNLNTNLGTIEGTGSINWRSDLIYNADLKLNNFSAISIVDNSVPNALSGIVKISGKGVDINNMRSNIVMNLYRSYYDNIKFRDLSINASIVKGGLIKIDSLKVGFERDSSDIFFNEGVNSIFIAQGFINLTNEAYGLSSEFSNVNLKSLMKNTMLPEDISGNLNITSSGFEVDSIMGLASLNIESCTFNDRSMLPLSILAKSYAQLNGDKIVSIESPLADFKISGEFSIPDLMLHLSDQIGLTEQFFTDRFSIFDDNVVVDDIINEIIINENIINEDEKHSFPTLNCKIESDIKDISLISSFIDDMYFDTKAIFEANIRSDSSSSSLIIKKFDLDHFNFEYFDLYFHSTDLEINSTIEFTNDLLPKVNTIAFDIKSDAKNIVNGLTLDSNSIQLDFQNDDFDLYVSTNLNDIINVKFNSTGQFTETSINTEISLLDIVFDNKFNFQSDENISIELAPNLIRASNINLSRDNAESFVANFNLDSDKIDNSDLIIHNLDLTEYLYLLDPYMFEQLKTLTSKIDTINVAIDGKVDNPDITIGFMGSNLAFNKKKLGNLRSDLTLRDSVVKGNLNIRNNDLDIVKLRIKSLPMGFSFSDYQLKFQSTDPLSATVDIQDIPLAVSEPFISGISDLDGTGKIQIIFGGYLPDKVNYRGKLLLNDVSLRSEFNNISYKADADLELDRTGLEINSLVLRNRAYDLPHGQANISGRIDLENFDVKKFDLRLHSNKLLLLSNESKKALPYIYGDLIIGTGKVPMYFTGSIDKPEFTGNIELLKADLFMPQMQSGSEQQSKLIYVTKKELEERAEETDSTKIVQASNGNGNGSKNFFDLLNIDVKIDLKSNLKLKMDINSTTSINADINTKKNSPPIRFIKDRNKSDTEFFAQLHLFDKSHLNFIKSFKTTGDINFPTGSLAQPYLDLTASYEGKTNIDNEIRKYEVQIMIKGGIEKPQISFTYLIDDVEAFGDQSEIERDAIMLLLTGRTNREMSGGESTAINPGLIGEQTGLSLIETQLSKSLTEMLLNTGFVESADVNIGSGDLENVTVELSGQIDFIGDLQWTVGGNISDFTKHFITLSTPLGSLLDYEALNNVVLEMSRSVSEQISQTQDQKEWEVKVKLNNIVW